MNNKNKVKNNELQQWKKMEKNCITQWTCPVLTSNGKHILFVGNFYDSHGIVMYDVLHNTYPEHLKCEHPKNTKFDVPGLAFDSNSDSIIVWGGKHHSCFIIRNLNTNEWDSKVCQNTSSVVEKKYNVKDVGRYSRMIWDPKHILHVIGGFSSNVHMTYNSKEQVFVERFAFHQFRNFYAFGLCCDSIKNRLILFGGYKYGGMIDGESYLNDIWFFNLSTNIWRKINDFKLKTPLAFFGFVFIHELQIVLLFGGETGSKKQSDIIWMLDFNINSCVEITAIKCPMKSLFHALLVPDTNHMANIHLFHCSSQHHWCVSLKSILPLKYYQKYCNLRNTSEMRELEMKKEQQQMYAEMEQEKILNRNMKNKIETQDKELNDYKQQLTEMQAQLEIKSLMEIKQDELSASKETKEEDMEGNINIKHLKEVQNSLPAKQQSFKTYFYQTAKNADKYYQTFVDNEFNDLDILMEFDSSDLKVLTDECHMNRMHAKHLLKNIKVLIEKNNDFQQWLSSIGMQKKYYEQLMNAGIVTLAMLEERFVCPTDLVEFLGETQMIERDGVRIWDSLPKNAEQNYNNVSNEMDITAFNDGTDTQTVGFSTEGGGEGK